MALRRAPSCARCCLLGYWPSPICNMSWTFLIWLVSFILQASLLGVVMYTVRISLIRAGTAYRWRILSCASPPRNSLSSLWALPVLNFFKIFLTHACTVCRLPPQLICLSDLENDFSKPACSSALPVENLGTCNM